MSDNTFHHRDPDFDVDLLMFCPHRIRPPDVISVGLFSRAGMWISVIFCLLLFCPRAGSDRWSVFDGFSRNFAEAWLLVGSQFPRHLEGFELGFISHSYSKPLSVIYNITPNNDSWLFITPCSHFEYIIVIQSLVAETDNKSVNKTPIASKGPPLEWYRKVTKIDMKLSSGLGENISITNWKRQEMHVKNLKLGIMRVDINRNDFLPSVYMIRQYSGRIDAFYPRIPPDPSVRVCVSASKRPTLSIYVSRAYNTDLYCATFNFKEDLPNFCTAQLRIEKTLFQTKILRENLNIRRPRVFDDYYRNVNIDPIQQFEFRCFKTNRFDVSLPDIFTKQRVFINIYAVNIATEFTDSYQPVTYSWGDYHEGCDSLGRTVTMDGKVSHIWVMGNETVLFNIQQSLNGNEPMRLFYQGCMSNQKQSLQMFGRESQTPLCVGVANSRVTAFCDPLRSGEYRFQHNILGGSNYSMPVGQIFLSNNIRAFPHLVCNKTKLFSLNLHRAPLKDSRNQYLLNISFTRVQSPYEISYYFYILVYPTPANNKDSLPELMSRIRYQVQAERNFCRFIYDQKNAMLPIHKVTLKGRGCESGIESEYHTSIPGLFDGNNTYAVLVYFSRASSWRNNVVQFYSNVVFTMYNEEEVF